ncbi:hypothetical protein [Allofournierella massiliensis]|uniref:hypothetical protein n=2 Tax=Allofournierella massiliensis TaxID=1650663 RepID=UPI00356867FA
MTNTLKHLSLLTRMENSGLKPRLTGKFPEDALDQTCERVETFQLQDRLRAGDDNAQIQKELVRTPEFAMLYRALCDHAANDEAITSMLQSAAACGEQLTQYPQEWVLAAAVTDLPPSLRLYYMKFYLPFIKYEEEEQAIIDNLNAFPAAEREKLPTLTDAQRDMMRQPFLGPYLFNWHDDEHAALVLLEQNRPLQRILTLLYRQGVTLALDAERIKDLHWVEMADVMKFRRLLAAFEYDTEDLDAFFEQWLENHAGQYDLNWFISRTAPLDKKQRQEILRNDLSYLNVLYSGRLHLDFSAIRRHQFPILTYAVQHGKKHFLDLVSEHSELFLSLGRYALLFEDKFCEHCNLNSLTARNLQACDTVERGSSYFDLLEDGRQYTFEEMWLLWRKDEIYVRLYAMLTPLSVDRRLLTLRQLLKYGLVSRHMEDQELEQLARCLLEKPFSEWYRGTFGHIRSLTRRTAMRLLQRYEQLQVFIPELQSEADAIFALNNEAVIAGQKNWAQVRASVLTMDQDWLDLKQRFSFTDEFVEQHREPVTNFLLRGGSAMVRSLYDYLQGNDKAIEALRRIVQAELMGQFYALKYFADDLQREIRYPISEVQEAAWKRNLTLERGPFSAEEADDFYFTMRLGELPHSTCLSCWTGSQRDCLLAAFDSNKKMILIWKGEDIVARACIRLTKGAFQRPADFDFSFADLAQEQPADKMGAGDEMLILFLECIYTSGLNDEEAETAMRMAVSLVTQKAAAIGAVAVLARCYQGCYDRDQYVGSQFYVYISKSKNGQQYLDSMGGAAVTSHKEQYTGAVFLVEQAAMRMTAPQKEDESYE